MSPLAGAEAGSVRVYAAWPAPVRNVKAFPDGYDEFMISFVFVISRYV